MKRTYVCMNLINEDETDVYAADVEPLGGDLYRIIDHGRYGEGFIAEMEFPPGSIVRAVRVNPSNTPDGDFLLAVERVG